MRQRIFICSLLIAASIACTSINEDRGACPCWCSIDFTKVDTSIDYLYLWFFDKSGVLLYKDTLYSAEYSQYYELELKRGIVDYYVWGNIADNTILDDRGTVNGSLLKLDSKQADPLYFYSKSLNTLGENQRDTVIMNKEHSVINIYLAGVYNPRPPLRMEITMETLGQNIDGRFINGSSKIEAEPDDGERCMFSFRIMRQQSVEEIKMSLYSVVNNHEVSVNDFPLGSWLKELGYTMQDKELSDITIELDIAMGIAIITIEDWNLTESVKIVM